MRKGGKQHNGSSRTRMGHVWAPVVVNEATDSNALRDELYQETKDELEAELGVTLEGKVDDIGWLELHLDRSDDVIHRSVDVIKNVMWMVTGEKPTVKMTARGAKVYNSFAVASPEMLPNHLSSTNTFSLVMHIYPPTNESKVKTTMGEVRRLLSETDDANADMCEELFTELEGSLKDELGEENVRAMKTSKSKPMLSSGVRYFGRIYVTRNTDRVGPKTFATISKTVQSILMMMDGAASTRDELSDDPSYVSSFATIDIERTYGATAFDGYTLYVIQHLDKNKVHEAAQKDHLVEFILEELHVQLSEKYGAKVKVSSPGWLDKVAVSTPLPLTNEKEARRTFGDISQITFDCIRDVTGDEPKIEIKPRSSAHRGMTASIETPDVRATVYLSDHGWTYVTVTRKEPLHEAALPQTASYQSLLDQAMNDMLSVNKTLEKAHEQAPAGAPKAIIMGLHSDVFNTVATFREYLGKLKGLKEARAYRHTSKDPNALHATAKEFAEELAAQIPNADVYDYSEQLTANTYDFTSVEFRVNFEREGAPDDTELWETIRNILWAVSGIEPSEAPVTGDRYMTLGNDDFAVAEVSRTTNYKEIRIIALNEDTERLDLRKNIKEASEPQDQSVALQVYEELLQGCKDEFGEKNVRERRDLSEDDGELRTFSMADVRTMSVASYEEVRRLRDMTMNVIWVVTGDRPRNGHLSDWHERFSTDDVSVSLDMRSRETIVMVDDVFMSRMRMGR